MWVMKWSGKKIQLRHFQKSQQDKQTGQQGLKKNYYKNTEKKYIFLKLKNHFFEILKFMILKRTLIKLQN